MKPESPISILITEPSPGQAHELRHRFQSEWGEIDPFEHDELIIPKPIIALVDDNMVGGLAFTAARDPGGERLAVWINALLVARDHRRQGIATRLVQEAEKSTFRLGIDYLYARTDTPNLYTKLNWVALDSGVSQSILRKQRNPPIANPGSES